MRETRDKGRTADYTLEELIFTEDATMIRWEAEIDAMRGMVKARNFGSHAERVDEEKGLGIKCGKADHGEKAVTISPDSHKTAKVMMTRRCGFKKGQGPKDVRIGGSVEMWERRHVQRRERCKRTCNP